MPHRWLDSLAARWPAGLAPGLERGLWLAAAVSALVLAPPRASPPQPAAAPAQAAHELGPDLVAAGASHEVRALAAWVLGSADHEARPFVIVDKKSARVFVFEASGRLLGAADALLGAAVGDDTVPGIGRRPVDAVQAHERTTPAGRFQALPGRNALDEDVLWVDYEAGVSMHRVRLTHPAERRLQRLATATVADNRISAGCINLPADFFDSVLWPAVRARRSIVYVLPEVKLLHDVFSLARLDRPL